MADIDSKIDEILKPLVEELRSWVDSELGGTSFHGDAIKAIDEDTSTVKPAIKNLLLEARKQEREIALTYLHDTNRKQDYLNKLARLAALQKELE